MTLLNIGHFNELCEMLDKRCMRRVSGIRYRKIWGYQLSFIFPLKMRTSLVHGFVTSVVVVMVKCIHTVKYSEHCLKKIMKT
jgi:hypothetical protein